MNTPNTRQLDQMIRTAESRLRGVRNGEVSALSASEQARVLLHAGRGARRVMRSKSPRGAEAAIERIFAAAEQRYASEIRAAQQARQQLVDQAAAAKAAKKSSGWW
jgi:hypothetical protein